MTALRTVLWPIKRREIHRYLRLADLCQRRADIERGSAAVAGHDRRHAHPHEVLRQRPLRHIVRVRVHVDETGRDDQSGGIDTLLARGRRERSDRGDFSVLDRDVRTPRPRRPVPSISVPPVITRS